MPIPWSGDRPDYGFAPAGSPAQPWLPKPDGWGPLTVAAQLGQPDSMLELYRAALRMRHRHPALGDGSLEWLDLPAKVLGFRRHPGFVCVVNFGPDPIRLADLLSDWSDQPAPTVLFVSRSIRMKPPNSRLTA